MSGKAQKSSAPEIKKYPTEYFGFPYTANSAAAKKARAEQYCPFIKRTCTKPRKSEPHIKVGICSVGYRGDFLKEFTPIIICPCRFNVDSVFGSITDYYFGKLQDYEEIVWATEVSLGVGGSVDYVAVKKKKFGGVSSLEDFVCIEFQAAGTTGTPWEAITELKKAGKFSRESYAFGINWANEFAKTMMQQVYKKGQIIELWGKKLIFVVQDVALGYLRAHYDTSGLRELRNEDSIYFYTYKIEWDGESCSWKLEPHEQVSARTEGIRKILAGATQEQFPTIAEFIRNIERKLIH